MSSKKYIRNFLASILVVACLLISSVTLATVLDVTEMTQEQNQWCWDGVSACVLDYYGATTAQCTIAEYTRQVVTWHDFGSVDCCVDASQGCNYWNYNWGAAGSIQDILVHFAGISNSGAGKLSQAQCETNIAANRPFIPRWEWDAGGGHFIVGHGIETDGTFYYMDPWFGEGLKISTYAWVSSGGTHTWTHTNVMNTSPCECNEDDECCDGCSPINEGGSCIADSDGCTIDSCQSGACVVGDAPDCSDQCNTGICQSTGDSSYTCDKDPSGFESNPCDDSDPCTEDDVCTAGVCGGDEMDCDDGLFCNGLEFCDAGICVDGTPPDCSDSNDCTENICDETNDECTNPDEADGTLCDDGLYCTAVDRCQAGQCSDTTSRDCSHFSDQCNLGFCNEAINQCEQDSSSAHGQPCDDGLWCTTNDICDNGYCASQARDCSQFGDQCNVAECNEAQDICVSNPDPLHGNNCNDDLYCTVSDVCTDGTCGGVPKDCSDWADECNTATCNEGINSCEKYQKQNGVSCNDGLNCTQFDNCQAGECVVGKGACDDDIDCTVDFCSEIGAGYECSHSEDSTKCDNQLFCDGYETCDDQLGCVDGQAADCSYLDGECTTGQCNEKSNDYECVAENKADDTPCLEGDNCIENASCQSGTCEYDDVDCDDGFTCTTEYCDTNLGCVYTVNHQSCFDGKVCTTDICRKGEGCVYEDITGSCNDNDLCTNNDVCTAGECAGQTKDCSHLDEQCSIGQCNTNSGMCESQELADDTECEDGMFCTSNDVCISGECIGDYMVCNDGIDCTEDACSEELLGCVYMANNGLCGDINTCTTDVCNKDTGCNFINNTLPCDTDHCLANQQCSTGECTGGSPVDCSMLEDTCNTAACDSENGLPQNSYCVQTSKMDGADCDDEDFCTIDETCTSGLCEGEARICDDSIECTADSCNSEQARCIFLGQNDLCADQNPCTIDVCNIGLGCVNADISGDECDDGDNCTTNGICQSGECLSEAVDCSYLQSDCQTASCDPNTGGCKVEYFDDSTLCNDSDICTLNDHCSAGACVGEANSCDDSVACTVDSCDVANQECKNIPTDSRCEDSNYCTDNTCDSVEGCIFDPNTLPCNDEDYCTTNDVCENEQCAGEAVDCHYLDNGCQIGICNENNGTCYQDTADDGYDCDDDTFCTVNDECISGVCGGVAMDCDDDVECTVDTCSEVRLECMNEPDHSNCDDEDQCTDDICSKIDGCHYADNTNSCNDDDPCTINDVCSLGSCAGELKDCSHLDDVCNTGTCDSQTGECVKSAANENGTCDDGNFCMENDVCLSGVCTGQATDCSDPHNCTIDTCNEVTDECEHQAVDSICFDDNPCNVETCSVRFGCSTNPAPPDTPCDDGDPCTTGETCSNEQCQTGQPRDCNTELGACANGICNQISGECDPEFLPDGTSCDDGLFCTIGEGVCSVGICVSADRDCTDSVNCTIDSCNEEMNRCDHIADNTACNDQDPCTNNICSISGGCSNPDRDCNLEVGICNTGVCNSQTGACDPVPVQNGTTCDDEKFCTVSDQCTDGTCLGTARNCSDAYDCTTDSCDEENSACKYVTDNAACDDGNLCTDNACDKDTGCVTAYNDRACSDNNPCTLFDICADGSCVSGITKDCSSLDEVCISGECNTDNGDCVAANKEDETLCDDGLFCTETDQCQVGVCTGTQKDCADLIACTVDTCDEDNDLCVNTPSDELCIDDDLNDCQLKACSATMGCADLTKDDWSVCSDDSKESMACFAGVCESVGKFDVCIRLDHWDYGTQFVDLANYHNYQKQFSNCQHEEQIDADAFFDLSLDDDGRYVIVTPSANLSVGIQVGYMCDFSAVCEEPVFAAPGVEISQWFAGMSGKSQPDYTVRVITKYQAAKVNTQNIKGDSKAQGSFTLRLVADLVDGDTDFDADLDADVDYEIDSLVDGDHDKELAEKENDNEIKIDGDFDLDKDKHEQIAADGDITDRERDIVNQPDGDISYSESVDEDNNGGAGSGGCRQNGQATNLMLLILAMLALFYRKQKA